MVCPVCDKHVHGAACSCGWAPEPVVSAAAPARTSRPWRFCEWTTAHGTCGAPTGTVSAGRVSGPMAGPRFCAWHRERECLSLKGTGVSEREAFEEFLARFPAGTSYQPFPGIWDKDADTLWLLVTGAIPFSEVEAQLCRRITPGKVVGA